MELVRLGPLPPPRFIRAMSIVLSSELFWALLVFVVVTLFTPGPNNTMLLASGLNFGFRRGLPHLFGVALGFGAMVLAVGVGLGAVFQAYPAAYTVLKYVGRGLSALARLADRHGRRHRRGRGGAAAVPSPSWREPPSSGSTRRAG